VDNYLMGAADAKMLSEAQALLENLKNPMWRISHLYKIIVKDEDEEESDGLVMLFKPNRAQRRFIERMWHRNIILKARQLGFSTLIAILWLDHALFNANVSCGIIAHNLKAAGKIFRDKVKFAYDNLPPALKDAMPLTSCNSEEMVFKHNNSSIMVSTSMRSGTIHRLHVSEYGKICAKMPEKAQEVKTGSIPAVPQSGVIVIESTAEGAEGHFHDMTQIANKNRQAGKKLTSKDYRLHFYAWFEAPEYKMDATDVTITAKDHDYFDKIEATAKVELSLEQRAWYVKTRETDFAGNEEDMWQEYPSTIDESFQQSSEGCYYSNQMTAVRKSGRILRIPVIGEPVNTFWDIGNSDGTAIWFHQIISMEDRFILYHEAHGQDLAYYVRYLQNAGFVFNKHFLPHDADHSRLSSDQNKSIKQQLEDLKLQNIEIVPRIDDINAGILLTRKHFASAYFDEAGCADGIKRLDNYKRKYNTKFARYINEPEKLDGNSEGADAFRQWAQAKELGMVTMSGSTSQTGGRAPSDWRVG
jgi:hypothetical protein